MNINHDYPTSSRTLILMVVMICVIKVVWIKGAKSRAKTGYKKPATSSKQPFVSSKEATKDFTAEADPRLYAPNASIPPQQGMDEGTKNTSYDHISVGTGPHVLADQTKSVSEGLETVLTQPTTKREASFTTIHGDKKRHPLLYMDLDLLEDDHVIIVDESDEHEPNAETEDTLVPRSSSHSSLPTKMKDPPSKFNELTEEIKSITSQVTELKTLPLELPEEFLSLPAKVESAQEVLESTSSKTEDQSVPASVGQADIMPAEREKDTNQATISQLFQRRAEKDAEAGKRNQKTQQPKQTTQPTTTPIIITHLQSPPRSTSQPDGEHIKKDKGKKVLSSEEAEKEREHIHLTEEQVNHQKKLDEKAKAGAAKQEGEAKKAGLIDLLGPEIVHKYYKEDGTSEVIPSFKANDLHLGEWREVVKACPNRKGKG
nr:hypothetical protein [Tanacetum cinerariifolium]